MYCGASFRDVDCFLLLDFLCFEYSEVTDCAKELPKEVNLRRKGTILVYLILGTYRARGDLTGTINSELIRYLQKNPFAYKNSRCYLCTVSWRLPIPHAS